MTSPGSNCAAGTFLHPQPMFSDLPTPQIPRETLTAIIMCYYNLLLAIATTTTTLAIYSTSIISCYPLICYCYLYLSPTTPTITLVIIDQHASLHDNLPAANQIPSNLTETLCFLHLALPQPLLPMFSAMALLAFYTKITLRVTNTSKLG